MPPRGRGPRLWPRRERRDAAGRITHPAVWLIRDGSHQESTRCRLDDSAGAERALQAYIARKHIRQAAQGARHPDHIPVADVIGLYARDVGQQKARPKELKARLLRLLTFFKGKTLSQVNGALCRSYWERRGALTAARRELEDLRAAINHYHHEGLCREIIKVMLPPRGTSRERWLSRSEVARLLWCAWRYREKQKGKETDRRSRQHVARFILVGVYTGTRSSAVCAAALRPEEGRGWIDLKQGVFYRRPAGQRETKKRQPPIPLPRRLLAHLRRWKRKGQRYAVEWNGEPVRALGKAFRNVVKDARLGPDVTPHSLRHTAATWLMQAGVDRWTAEGYLGMSAETLDRVYAHHHPDYLKAARDAFDKPRRATGSANTTRGQKGNKGRKRKAKVAN